MGFTLFGVNNNKKETKLNHFIYETKLAVLICPKNFTENSINPDVFYKLKKLYNIKTINIFDRIKGVNKDIIKGLYKVRGTSKPVVRVLGSGPLMEEALKAAKLLKEDWGIDPGVWNVTSFSELRRDAEETERWNLMHPEEEQKKSHLEMCLSKNSVPTVAVSDYVKMVSEQIGPYVPGPYYTLGTDGFGRSDSRQRLREFFEVDAKTIVQTSVYALHKLEIITKQKLDSIYKKLGVKKDKPNPWEV